MSVAKFFDKKSSDVDEQIARVAALIQKGDIVIFKRQTRFLFVWGTRHGRKLEILRESFPNVKNESGFLELLKKIARAADLPLNFSEVEHMPKRYWARRLL
jgi:hypothetical protein